MLAASDRRGAGRSCRRGAPLTGALVASRTPLSRSVAAAIAEVGGTGAICALLENSGATIAPASLIRMAERRGSDGAVRALLLQRDTLPGAARHLLMQSVRDALLGIDLVRATIGAARIDRLAREAGDAATAEIVAGAAGADIPALVEHLRGRQALTPAFLLNALCTGRIDFFCAAIIRLSGCDERRTRSILAGGRGHAVRALYKSAGLGRDISAIFVEATMIWRRAAEAPEALGLANICADLVARCGQQAEPAAAQLLDMVEKLHISEARRTARDFASGALLQAA